MYTMYVNNTDIQGVTLGLNFRLNDEQIEKSKPFNSLKYFKSVWKLSLYETEGIGWDMSC